MIKRALWGCWFLAMLLLAGGARDVWAAAPVSLDGYRMNGIYYPDATSLCKAMQSSVSGAATASAGGGYCFFKDSSGNDLPAVPYTGYKVSGLFCMPGFGMPNPNEPDSSKQCDPPPPTCKRGNVETLSYETVYSNYGTSQSKFVSGPPPKGGSDGNCEVDLTDVVACYERPDKTTYCTYKVTQTGLAKQANVSAGIPGPNTGDKIGAPTDTRDTPPPFASSPCPGGTSQAGVDSSGIPICVGQGTLPSSAQTALPTKTSPAVTTTNSDGGTSTVQTVATTNKDGSTTTVTTTTTVGADGSKSVSQTASTTAATSGSPGSSDKPSDTLCSQNPNLNICQNSTVSGACGTVSCTGDAIQCSTLRAAAAMQCQMKQDADDIKASPLTASGDALLNGTDPMVGVIPSADKATVVQGPTSLDTAGFLGEGAFFLDKQFTVRGKTFTVPFSKAAPAFLVLRYALMLVAALVSFKIIRTAVLT